MGDWRVMLAAAGLVLSVVGVGAAQSIGGSRPEERYFRVDSAVVAGRRGPEIEGYVYNVYDLHALHVRLRVEALDTGGRRVDERIVLIPLDVPARGRAYFRAPTTPGASSARVSVVGFDWAPRGGM